MSKALKNRRAFTLVELLVVIAIIGILIGMLLPAVQSIRAAARRTSCSNKVRQIALAIHNYESTHQKFPVNQIGPGVANGSGFGPGFYSWMVPILPQLEQGNVYDSLDLRVNNGDGDGYKISSTHPNAVAANTLIDTFQCPSDTPNRENSVILGTANPAPSNYVGNAGWPSYATGYSGERPMQGDPPKGKHNGVIPLHHPSAPVSWHSGPRLGMSSVRDGTSNTAMISERLVQPSNSQAAIEAGDIRVQSRHILERVETLSSIYGQLTNQQWHAHTIESAHLGRSWSSGNPLVAPTYLHVQTPNTTMGHYSSSVDQGDFVVTPSSHHSNGVNLALVDGSVRFVADTVSREVWWAIGGRDDGRIETLSD